MRRNHANGTAWRAACVALLAVGLLPVQRIAPRASAAAGPAAPAAALPAQVDEVVRAAVRAGNIARVIVMLRPAGGLQTSGLDDDTRRAVIGSSQDAVLARLSARLPGVPLAGLKRFEHIPFMAMQVDAGTLAALESDPAIISITEDAVAAPALSRSLPLIRADAAHLLGVRGAGQTIAVLDGGVDKAHPDLSGKVLSEACYGTTTSTAPKFTTLCPNGQDSQTGANSARPPGRLIDGFDHGTHVAAIAAGVAPGASMIAINVFSRVDDGFAPNTQPCQSAGKRSPCVLTSISDYLLGLQRVYNLRNTYAIAAVNMSLGAGSYITCDSTPAYTPVRLQIDLLRSVGIATVIAAGNDGYRLALAAPSCLSNAISVGATTTWPDADVDDVADFSNAASNLTLFAPGVPIEAAVPTSATDCGAGSAPVLGRCFKGGTSMAAPHVAGAVAVLKSARPAATVSQLISALTSTGPFITDQRPGGVASKRRLDVYGAYCTLTGVCDSDDFRTLTSGAARSGTMVAQESEDFYWFNGAAGQRITVNMRRTNGTLDPFLSVWSAGGALLAFNNDGAGVPHARIQTLILPRTERYRVIADGTSSSQSGGYSITVTQDLSTLNPVPLATALLPVSATVGSLSMWVQVRGSNFVPGAAAFLNGSPRQTIYHSPDIVWIGVLASDMTSTGSRSISVSNPTPGGGATNALSFYVSPAFNGFTSLLAPTEPNTSVGLATTFGISWTHPISSWRNMQSMEMMLRDNALNVPLRLRLTESNPTSTLALLNSAGTPVYSGTLVSGQFGAPEDWVITDTVTLHFGQTKFVGSGQTIILTPVVTFGPLATGAYDVRFSVDDDAEVSEIQNADVLGRLTISPATCTPLESVSVSGLPTVTVGVNQVYTAVPAPMLGDQSVVYTWMPEPLNGQGTAMATYAWSTAGMHVVSVLAEACDGFVADLRQIAVHTTPGPDLSIGKGAPPVALASQPITYTVIITNSGAQSAQDLVVEDTLPAGATHLGGGSLFNGKVRFELPTLPGFGASATLTFAIQAAADVTNSIYAVNASGGYSAAGAQPAVTRIVDVVAPIDPLVAQALGAPPGVAAELPAGIVANAALGALDTDPGAAPPVPAGGQVAGPNFRLDVFASDPDAIGDTLGEPITISVPVTLMTGTPKLYHWTGGAWRGDGVTCAAPVSGRMTCTVQAAPVRAHYAVFSGLLDRAVFLPLLAQSGAARSATISAVTNSGDQYAVAFSTTGFTPTPTGAHVHFYFNTVPQQEAGMPGAGPWWMYSGSSPYTGIPRSARPTGAVSLCVLVANADHSIQPGSGTCHPLP